jgi:hypothetical protein
MAIAMGMIMVSGGVVGMISPAVVAPGSGDSGHKPSAQSALTFAAIVPFFFVGSLSFAGGLALLRFRQRIYDFVERKIRAARGRSEVNEFARQQRPLWIGVAGVLLLGVGAVVLVSGVMTVVQLSS